MMMMMVDKSPPEHSLDKPFSLRIEKFDLSQAVFLPKSEFQPSRKAIKRQVCYHAGKRRMVHSWHSPITLTEHPSPVSGFALQPTVIRRMYE